MGAAKGGSSLASSGYNGMSMAGGPMDNMGSMGGNQFMTASHGAVVPGQAPVQGDSDRNDKVPAMLSPGEVVLPRSVTQSSDPVAKAAEFMKHLRSPKSQGYGGVIQARMACGGRVRR